MLRSSLGFHTLTLCLPLLNYEADKLLIDFSTYRENTKLIEMYKKNERNEPIIYHHKSPIIPLKVNVCFIGRYRGIKWCIRTSEKPFGFSGYILEVTINPKILAGIYDYLTAATYIDMRTAITNFNNVSKKISPLLYDFFDYQIARVDYCINICLDDFISGCTSEQMMTLIKKGDIPPHYKEWMEYDHTAHRMKSKPESFYLKSKSVNINFYSKYMQLLNKSQEYVAKGHEPIDQEILDASRNIYRFEVQCKYHKIYTFSQEAARSGNQSINKYENLLNPVSCIEIVSSYYKKTIGKGDWYALPEAVRLIKSKNFNCQKEQRLIQALKYVSHCRSLAKAKASFQSGELLAFKQTLKELANFNINPVTIPREWNIKHIPNFLRTFFDKLLLESADTNNLHADSCTAHGYLDYLTIFKQRPI